MISPILFVGSFMFLASLLLLGVIYSRAPWTAKAVLVASSLAFSGFFYIAFVGSLGYAARITPPEIFRFIYGIVREPYPAKNDAGAIYIWMMLDNDEPRAVEVPFSVETRHLLAQAKKRIEAGEIVFMGLAGSRREQSAPGQLAAGNLTKSDNRGSDVPYKVDGIALELKPPPDTLPKKELHQ